MRSLSAVLLFKVLVTFTFWVIPLLFFPSDWLQYIGFESTQNFFVIRLLGLAYLSLTVGYTFAYFEARKGIVLKPVIWVGLVSNGSAAIMLTIFLWIGYFSNTTSLLKIIVSSSVVATGSIAVGLWILGISSKKK